MSQLHSNVEILGKPGLARQLAAGATSANTVLSGGVYASPCMLSVLTFDLKSDKVLKQQVLLLLTSLLMVSGLTFLLHRSNIAIIRDASDDGVLNLRSLADETSSTSLSVTTPGPRKKGLSLHL